MKTIKIHGLKRTGTNFLSVTLEKNFDVKVLTNNPTWKHGLCKHEGSVIIMVRHPLEWLGAYCKYEKLKDINHFAKRGDLFSLWNFSYWHWSQVDCKQKTFVRYEDLRDNPTEEAERLKQMFNLSLSNSKGMFQKIVNIVKPGEKLSTSPHEVTKYYDHYSNEAIQQARKVLDPELLSQFRYEI